MALQAWMKKEGVFDRDICRELQSQFGIEDPEYDFSKISKAKWKKFQKTMIQQKKQEIKDNTSIRRLEQKFSKINKKWKSQQGKKIQGHRICHQKTQKRGFKINKSIKKGQKYQKEERKTQKHQTDEP
eukprot:536713_1